MQEYLKRVTEDEQVVNNLFNTLGVKIDSISEEKAVLRLPVQPLFLQGGGNVAGGIIATLADEAMAHCVIAGLGEGQRTATVEMNIRYLRGISSGEMIATATIIRRGRTIVTAEAVISKEDGVTLAVAGASFWIG